MSSKNNIFRAYPNKWNVVRNMERGNSRVKQIFKQGDFMSLDKAIKYGKEKRKQYEGGKAFFKSCRNHGDCKRCKNDRLYNQMRDEESSL